MFKFCRAVPWFFLMLSAAALSQTFEEIKIKVANTADARNMRIQVLPTGDLVARAVPVITLLSYAYDVPSNPSPRLLSLPDWAVSERYDIEAKAPFNAIATSFQDNEAQGRMKQMIRQLLADRFNLIMQTKSERMAVYILSVSSGGAPLQKSTLTTKDCVFDTDPQGCHNFAAGFGHPLIARAVSMDDLAHYIENWTDLPVENRTDLSGLFTLSTEGWLPMRLPPPPPNSTPSANVFASLPTIFTVLGKLGLELHRQEEYLPVYTVERIERPEAN